VRIACRPAAAAAAPFCIIFADTAFVAPSCVLLAASAFIDPLVLLALTLYALSASRASSFRAKFAGLRR